MGWGERISQGLYSKPICYIQRVLSGTFERGFLERVIKIPPLEGARRGKL
jgi:hypothetical protein